MARDHGISRATGYRYLDEIIDVLADQAPDLHEALEKAKADGLASKPPGVHIISGSASLEVMR